MSSAAAAWITPLGQNARVVLNAEGFTTLPATDIETRLNHVSGGYFRTIGTPLLAGRDFGPGEVVASPPVVIVNEELARRMYGRLDVSALAGGDRPALRVGGRNPARAPPTTEAAGPSC